MCIKLDEKTVMDYTMNYFAGIVASLVIVFALGQQNQLNNLWLFIAMILLYFVGLISIGLFKTIYYRKRQSLRTKKS